MKGLIALLLILSSDLFAYTISRGSFGEELYWNNTNQTVYLNTANSSLISSSNMNSIVSSSASEYTSIGFNINKVETSSGPTNGLNDIYFTNDSSAFGGNSVLALTKVSFSESTGVIQEADILINDAVFFSSTKGSGNYLGDLISHELGHFVGLGHSQVHGSTMFFSIFNGQDTLHSDDQAAVKHIYSSTTELSGTVAGGSGIGIFGAHVQAISSTDGEVKASTVSEVDGSFVISGLSSSETYYVYVEPLKAIDNLSSFYSTVRKNFCVSQTSYRGTFLESCRKSEEGKPQGVVMNGGSRNVGTITIGCDLSVPVAYMQNKPSTLNQLNIVDVFGNSGEATTGYFTSTEATNNEADEYEIDLSNYTVPTGDIYLDIKLVSQKLYSPVRVSLSSDTETIEYATAADGNDLRFDSDGNINLDVIGRIKLSSVSANNIFRFKVTPESLSDFIVGKPYSVDSFLPSSSFYKDDLNFYMMIMTISKKELGVYTKISEKKYNYQSNDSCLDAPSSYSVAQGTQTKSTALKELEKRKNNEDPTVLSCGTVEYPKGPGSGGMSFIFAFAIGLLATSVLRGFNSQDF
ncbi:MAG: hypothetical protein ACJAT2_002049 [Bacteriovoracaceae bacterium]|jgi:hypothetical protein